MPPAPTPVYDENGQQLLEWLMVLRYDPQRDVVTLSWTKDGDRLRASKRGAVAFTPDAIAEIQEGLRTTVVMLSAPSLF